MAVGAQNCSGYKISLKDLMKKRAIEFLNYSLHCILVVIVFFFLSICLGL